MHEAEKTVLDRVISEFSETESPVSDEDASFAYYSAIQVMKPKELTTEELKQGMVDGSQDGGIDGFFVHLNGALLSVDSPYLDANGEACKSLNKNPFFEVTVIQAKNSSSWKEDVWTALSSTLEDVLDPEMPEQDLIDVYNSNLIEQTRIYRKAQKSLCTKFPKVNLRVYYVSRSPEEHVSKSMERKRSTLEKRLSEKIACGAEISATHVGLTKLYRLSARSHQRSSTLHFQELIRTENAFIGLMSIRDYLQFLRNDQGVLTQELFDSNVRDFEGINQVNSAIESTLQTDSEADFWWMNNGVTILGDEVNCPHKDMTILEPLVVNGLQTSLVLHKSELEKTITDSRLEESIVIRVLISSDTDIRDSVIAGTNRQTKIPPQALFASQELQIDIERYFLARDWFYERRRNYYKNQQKPASRRIDITFLAQAMMTLMLGEPNTARARPNTLLTMPGGYDRVFPSGLDCEAYLVAAQLMKEVDSFLSSEGAKKIFDDKTNARYYIALGYVMLSLKARTPDDVHYSSNYKRIKMPLAKTRLTHSLQTVERAFREYGDQEPELAKDTIFKRQAFRDLFCKRIAEHLR